MGMMVCFSSEETISCCSKLGSKMESKVKEKPSGLQLCQNNLDKSWILYKPDFTITVGELEWDKENAMIIVIQRRKKSLHLFYEILLHILPVIEISVRDFQGGNNP